MFTIVSVHTFTVKPAMSPPNKDLDYLDRLRDYYSEYRHIPTIQRIAELMGFASKNAANKLLERLSKAGFITRSPDDAAWVPDSRFFERPLVDAFVRAGGPDRIEATGSAPFFVDDYLVRTPSKTIMVPVKGDSMIDAGIHDGDLVVIERGQAAMPGDFVVAIVDDEFTLKELSTEADQFILKPHNKAYPVIRPKGHLEIYGVVTGLVRRYRT